MALLPGRDLSETLEEVVLTVRGSNRERLDRYLQRKLGWSSRTKVQRLVTLGRVTVNERPGKPAMKVGRGVVVHVRLLIELSIFEEHPPLSTPVWEDPYLLAVSKRSGQLVHPTGKTVLGTVIDEVHTRYKELNERGSRPVLARLCHRLDRDTSGLLLIAKTIELRRAIQVAFEANQVRKGYIAVVEGECADDEFEVDAAIVDHIDRQRAHSNRLARLDDSGRASLTQFSVIGRFPAGHSVGAAGAEGVGGQGFSVGHCRPITGRQNQIRIHLASKGHPILGDTGYGSDPSAVDLPDELTFPDRALLHSFQLRFRHPVWGTQRELRAPVAADLRPFLLAAGVEEREVPTFAPLASPPEWPRVRNDEE